MLERIITTSDIMCGIPRIRNTEIGVHRILEELAQGCSFDDLMQIHPEISAEDIKACLLYASLLSRSDEIYMIPF